MYSCNFDCFGVFSYLFLSSILLLAGFFFDIELKLFLLVFLSKKLLTTGPWIDEMLVQDL